MKQIFREAKHTARLVNDLLILARADSRLDIFNPVPVDLTALFNEVCQQGRMLASGKGIDVEITSTTDPVIGMGEDSALECLFLILIDNAVKYTPSGESIRLGLRQETGKAVFTIKDSGIGIICRASGAASGAPIKSVPVRWEGRGWVFRLPAP
jgi:signal transduction histidine kinase